MNPKYSSPVSALHIQMLCEHIRKNLKVSGVIENTLVQVETDLGVCWRNGNYWPLTELDKATKKGSGSL